MLGDTQLAWLLAEIDAAAASGQLLCIFSDTGWYGTAALGAYGRIKVSNSDKWVAYTHERDLISDRIASAYAAVGKTPNAIVVCSDTHALQQDSGATQRNGLASVVCGPFDQHVHALPTFVESYEWTYPPHSDAGGVQPRRQCYQRLTFQESVPGTLTVTAVARDCTPAGGPVNRRKLVKTYRL
jgi:phosphodiesterase/alkaline phosphatase D-like protein